LIDSVIDGFECLVEIENFRVIDDGEYDGFEVLNGELGIIFVLFVVIVLLVVVVVFVVFFCINYFHLRVNYWYCFLIQLMILFFLDIALSKAFLTSIFIFSC